MREEVRGRVEEERQDGGWQEEREGENKGEKDGETGRGGEDGKREERQLAPVRSMKEQLCVSRGREWARGSEGDIERQKEREKDAIHFT